VQPEQQPESQQEQHRESGDPSVDGGGADQEPFQREGEGNGEQQQHHDRVYQVVHGGAQREVDPLRARRAAGQRRLSRCHHGGRAGLLARAAGAAVKRFKVGAGDAPGAQLA